MSVAHENQKKAVWIFEAEKTTSVLDMVKSFVQHGILGIPDKILWQE